MAILYKYSKILTLDHGGSNPPKVGIIKSYWVGIPPSQGTSIPECLSYSPSLGTTSQGGTSLSSSL